MRWIGPVHDTMPNCYVAEAFSFGKLKSSVAHSCIIAHEPTHQPRAWEPAGSHRRPVSRLLPDLTLSPEARLNGSIHILPCAAEPCFPGRAACYVFLAVPPATFSWLCHHGAGPWQTTA